MTNTPDTEILKNIKISKEEGVRLLFNRYYKPLLLYANEFTNSLPAAEDIVQDFFMRMWEDDYLVDIDPRALSSYLFTSVRNACYTHGHRKNLLGYQIELSELNIAEECAAELSKRIVEQVAEAIHKLPEKTSLVVMAILIQDKKYQEVADELNISINTVKTLLKNGMKALRQSLEDKRYLFYLFFLQKKMTPIHPF